jgi:hypothetical protein
MAAVHTGLARLPSRVNPSWTSVAISTRPGTLLPPNGLLRPKYMGRETLTRLAADW